MRNSEALNKYKHLTRQMGRAAVSQLFPTEVEYYLCAFELVNSYETEGYFVFPIQPSSITKIEPTRTNIKKSLSGITVLKNSSFMPQEISIQGNFGRRFKLMSRLDGVAFTSVNLNKIGIDFNVPVLSPSIKTGYGAVKLLQKIIQQSNVADLNGEPKKLYFYNMGFGESYLVTIPPSGATFSQTEDRNTIWQYSLNMTVLAPLSDVSLSSKREAAMVTYKGAINKLMSNAAADIKKLLV